MMKPSRSLSKGREAAPGSSFRVDRAFMEQNPPSPSGVIVASAPPAITTSHTPVRIACIPSPIAWLDAAHAVVVAMFGPLAPYCIAMCPGARLEMSIVMKKGLIFLGPPSMYAWW